MKAGSAAAITRKTHAHSRFRDNVTQIAITDRSPGGPEPVGASFLRARALLESRQQRTASFWEQPNRSRAPTPKRGERSS